MEEFLANNGTLIAMGFAGFVIVALTFLYTHNTLIKGLTNSIPVETIDRYLSKIKPEVVASPTQVDDIAHEIIIKVLAGIKELQENPPQTPTSRL